MQAGQYTPRVPVASGIPDDFYDQWNEIAADPRWADPAWAAEQSKLKTAQDDN
jgi:hypothetical protein